MDLKLIKQWVDVNSEVGLHLLANPDPAFALYDSFDSPEFDPQGWNSGNEGTNCFGYVMQARGETLCPGFVVKGKDAFKYRLADVYNGAIARSPSICMQAFQEAVHEGLARDGLMKADPEELYKPGHYLVALFLTELPAHNLKDFHFVVLNDNGRWSHVDGLNSCVSWTDKRHNTILNPANAFMGNDTVFDSFHHVPKGGALAIRAERAQESASIRRCAL